MVALKVFKMIVAYDGTRYHGFQRQIDNASMMKIIQILRKQQQGKQQVNDVPKTKNQDSREDDETDSKAFVLERPTKRPKYELDGSRKKHSKLSIQQILEMVCMDLVASSFPPQSSSSSSSSDAVVTTTTTTTINNSPMVEDDNNNNNNNNNNNANTPRLFSVDDLCLKFSGRTDRGVHATGQVVTVQLPRLPQFRWTSSSRCDHEDAAYENERMNNNKDDANNDRDGEGNNALCFWLCKSINSRLPLDVSVQDVECLGNAPVPFDPRRHVRSKRYTYTIKYRRRRPPPNGTASSSGGCFPELGPYAIRHALDSPILWVCPWSLDDSRFPAFCERLRGKHDYRNFVHKHVRDQTDHTLTIDKIEYEILNVKTDIYRFPKHFQNENTISNSPNENNNAAEMESMNVETVTGQFVFEATGFRRTMLRNIVGYFVDQCRVRDDEDGTTIVMEDKDPFGDEMAGKINAAPASGLCLESVTY